MAKSDFKTKMIGALLLVAILTGVLWGCGGEDDGPGDAPADREARLQRVLTAALAEQPWLPGVAAAVDFNGDGFQWSGAAGVSDVRTGQALRADASFRIASVTKTFLAATVYRLIEQGVLDPQETLDRLLAEPELELLASRGYRSDLINVSHLLAHISGLPDYAETVEYFTAVLADPTRRWTRWEQVEFALDRFARVGEPGEAFAYSDTGYLLLGEIVERRGGLPLAEAYRYELDFAGLGLSSTWLESLEPVPPGATPRLTQYVGDLDIAAIDPSVDLYGGGGLVSNLNDLNRFITALFAGLVVSAGSLASMTEASLEPQVGRGLFQYRFNGIECWGHGGFWGVLMLHCPAEGVSLSVVLTAQPDAAGSTFTQEDLAGRLLMALDLR